MYPQIHAVTRPDQAAVIMADTGDVMTYRELNDESIRLARAFRSAGLGVGDRVAIVMDNDARYLSVCWAARRIGLYYVPVNWHLTAAEVAYVVADSGAKALVVGARFEALAAELVESCRALRLFVSVGAVIEGFVDYAAALAGESAAPLDGETEGEQVTYTSGTTGRPKGGMRRLSGLHPADARPGPLVTTVFGFDANSVYLLPGAPLYHSTPLRSCMNATMIGATVVILGRFDPGRALGAIEQFSVTHSLWVPTMFVRMLRLPVAERGQYDLRTHRAALHAAAPCPEWVKDEMLAWWGPILTEYYGASEGGVVTTITSAEWLEHRGSVGRPLSGAVHILDESGRELLAGQVGIVYGEKTRPVVYHDDPAKTRAAYSRQGWVTVGDMGYLDPDGYLYITDRIDDMINSGGVNIYPQEVEHLLLRHPMVGDVAVLGIPDAEYGQLAQAIVQLSNPAMASEKLADELLAYCRANLATYKCPRALEFIAELPRTPAGKLYKRRLLDHHSKEHDVVRNSH